MIRGLIKRLARRGSRHDRIYEIFRLKYECFKELLASNSENLDIIADIEEKLQGDKVFGMSYIRSRSARAVFHTLRMVKSLDELSGHRYPSLFEVLERINSQIKEELERRKETPSTDLVLPYSKITKEMVDLVGGKSANLGEVLNCVKLPIPDGFAITTRAFESFLSYNDLVDEINKKKMEIDPDDPGSFVLVSEEIQRLIISAEIPDELKEAIIFSYEDMAKRHGNNEPPHISMRSSAIGEDSDLSYAGQYLSSLNVPKERILQTYKYIVASLYTPRAISYRLNKGIRDEDIAMSVACPKMVESIASGVIYSRHPFDIMDDNIIITAVWGLGPYAVGGIITPDQFKVSKDEGLEILRTTISHKPVQLVCNPDGGLVEIPVPEEKRDSPCLSPSQVRELASYAIKIEEHFHSPQDIEWALDKDGRFYILQARPLRIRPFEEEGIKIELPVPLAHNLLLEGGSVAHPGIGYGRAFHVRSDEDLLAFPDGAILIARHSSPKFVTVMTRAQAIITDSGSATGHMASLAREFAVPSIVDAKVATQVIEPGMEITVDAYSRRVYLGRVEELINLKRPRGSHMKDTPVYRTLRKVADLIVPLNLTDPRSPSFSPLSCKTLHDIMRFVHEVSYTEMFYISDLISDKGIGALKLDAKIPIDLHIIDLGDGISRLPEGSRKVTLECIESIPLKALLKGMMHEELLNQEPRPIELRGFISVMAEQMFNNPHVSERFGDRSYAIISDKYMNFSSRVGYHYSILDSYCSETISKNYITFSFKGGAADDIRRNRRARAIALILEEYGFSVDVKGDRVDARFQKYESPVIEERLEMVGRLLQFTRQMDMIMGSEESVETIAEHFLKGKYTWEPLLPQGRRKGANCR